MRATFSNWRVVAESFVMVSTVIPYLFYRYQPSSPVVVPLSAEYRYEVWRPTARRPLAPGLSPIVSAVWLSFHLLRLFANRDYSAGVIWRGDKVVHLTMVFPGFFRFPFMASDDLQFGALLTAPEDRGRGLAGYALGQLIRQYSRSGRQFWYITHHSNRASQQVAQRAGFRLVGRGDKVSRLGLRFFGRYTISEEP